MELSAESSEDLDSLEALEGQTVEGQEVFLDKLSKLSLSVSTFLCNY